MEEGLPKLSIADMAAALAAADMGDVDAASRYMFFIVPSDGDDWEPACPAFSLNL